MSVTTHTVPLNTLASDELKRRIVAARTLRNLSQAKLAELFVDDGMPREWLGDLERGDRSLNRTLVDALIRHLRVPERWFTDPEIDNLVYHDGTPEGDRLAAIEEQIRLARAETAVRAAEVLKLIEDRLPPTEASQHRRLG